jgi:polyisoprenoid-binding protein YceI
MTYRSTELRPAGDGFVALGDLTIKGVTRQVELAVELLGVGADAYGNERIGLEATGQISRKDFGIDFNIPLEGGKLLIGDAVTISLTVQAVRG